MTTTQRHSPWMKGDFHVIGARQTNVGEQLCEDAGLSAGANVLDIACGSGNTSLAAARREARVTGLDLVPALIDRAKRRAQSEGFDIEFHVGDAQQLPFDDASFDTILSTFGIMFAPDQAAAASEALRVLKPGGTLALSNWTVESLPGALFALGAKYGMPAAGPHPPIAWGTVDGIRRILGGHVRHIRIFDRVTYARASDAGALVAIFREYFGPTIALFEQVPANRHAEVEADLRSIYERYNRAVDGTLCAAMAYVNVVAIKGTP